MQQKWTKLTRENSIVIRFLLVRVSRRAPYSLKHPMQEHGFSAGSSSGDDGNGNVTGNRNVGTGLGAGGGAGWEIVAVIVGSCRRGSSHSQERE